MLLPSLIMAVLTSAIDTEGNLPEELTARLTATIKVKGAEPITVSDTFSGPRYTGPMGASLLFSPLASIVNILVRNTMAPVYIESIHCNVQIEPGRKVASIETVRLVSDTIEPGQDLKAFVTVKPYKGEREMIEVSIPIPSDFPEGPSEVVFCDAANSIRRQFRNNPALLEPRDLDGVLNTIRIQTGPKRTAVYVHVPAPEKGLSVKGQPLPSLLDSVRAVFVGMGDADSASIRTDMIKVLPEGVAAEGMYFVAVRNVAKDTAYSNVVSLSPRPRPTQ